MTKRMIEVRFVNNGGGGYAQMEKIAEGTTIGEFFLAMKSKSGSGINQDEAKYLIRVNTESCERSKVLEDGDRITITPTNIKGE